LLGCGGFDPLDGDKPGRNKTSRALRRQSHARGSPPFTATAAGRASRLPHRGSRCLTVGGSGTGAGAPRNVPHVDRSVPAFTGPPDRPSFPRFTRATLNARDMPRPATRKGNLKELKSTRVRA